MAGDLCPYCGTLLTSSLRFCVNCRRSVTEDKIKQLGSRNGGDEDDGSDGRKAEKFKLSRKTSYDGVRQVRTVFTTITTLLAIIFVYYFTMKFVIHEPIPFEDTISALIDQVQKHGIQSIGQMNQQQPTQTDTTSQPTTPTTGSTFQQQEQAPQGR